MWGINAGCKCRVWGANTGHRAQGVNAGVWGVNAGRTAVHGKCGVRGAGCGRNCGMWGVTAGHKVQTQAQGVNEGSMRGVGRKCGAQVAKMREPGHK